MKELTAKTEPGARRRAGGGKVWFAAALLATGTGLRAPALEPTTPLAEYGRQSWVMENGLPQNSVHALAQTPDGFLWLGTEAGLVRFDGFAFAVFDHTTTPALPSGDIRYLLETPDGALWVGTSEGLARRRNGSFAGFGARERVPAGAVTALRETPDGQLRMETENEAAEFSGGAWSHAETARSGTKDEIVFRAKLPDGALATATRSEVTVMRGGVRIANLRVAKELPGSRIQALLADREGCLWIGTNSGLARWLQNGAQALPQTDVLAKASVLSLLEDREGDLWVGTETDGLQVLRDTRFRNIGAREGLSSDLTSTVVEDNAGTIWVGTNGGGLNVIRRNPRTPGLAPTYAVRDVLLSDVILSLAAGRNGGLWVGTADGLNHIRGSAVDSFTSADGLPDDFVRSLLAEADGSLWIGTRHGLAHWTFASGARTPTRKEIYTVANGLGSDLVGAMARDAHGNLWIATLAGLSRLKGGKITNYTTADGLSSNVVTALLPRAGGKLLVGTRDRGWNAWDGTRFETASPPALKNVSVHSILEDASHRLWFATAHGIARCEESGAADCAHWLEFGPADGLRSRETATNSHPSAWRSRDGRLWFATPKGLVEIEPEHFPVNVVPPPVVVERFAVDDVDALRAPPGDANAWPKIQAGHNHFQFDYAGLSFVAPQKVRYRYRLDGFDHEWTDAGARRTAYYTNIPPGRYTFRVQAANNDGLWNTEGATLQFELAPHFYQTIWFYLLLTAAAAGLIVLLLKRRLLVAERQFAAVLGERNRIAREIHDTLAQGYVGISVQLEVLAELLRHHKVEAATQQLDTARAHVREGLAEARQSIWALRSQDTNESTLPVNLRRVTERADGPGLEARFNVHGAYRPLAADTEREILRVAQEAIHNVQKHAAAHHLSVRLDYGPAEIALEVRDDGQGFVVTDTASHAAGHYGFTGMRERAQAIGGALEVTSEPGAGTSVRLHAPAPREAE